MSSKRFTISLANKCQLLFGATVILILTAALSVVWLRMVNLSEKSVKKRAEGIASALMNEDLKIGESSQLLAHVLDGPSKSQFMTITYIYRDEFEGAAKVNPFVERALQIFQSNHDAKHLFEHAPNRFNKKFYRYIRAVKRSDSRDYLSSTSVGSEKPLVDPLDRLILVQFNGTAAQEVGQENLFYVIIAGVLAGLLAIVSFWLITTRLFLSPLRVLRETAAKVSEGDLNIRSDINTGDEFELLSDVFNSMLVSLKSHADDLQGINKSLDFKIGELNEANVTLYEANKVKGEFLANVSHELRTPLNSIIGFAEILSETLESRTGPIDEKRQRYIHNIITSSKILLELINDLLDLAKIEAGRVEIRIAPMAINDTLEGLLGLMKPQANKKEILLRLKSDGDLPMVKSDAGKFQQILFNFISNAIKFTPQNGTVTVTAQIEKAITGNAKDKMRISVSDTGLGIAEEDFDLVFEKFTQLESPETKMQGGTGLGLTICKELAMLLQGKIELESEEGSGATFSLIMPIEYQDKNLPLMPDYD